MNTLLLRKFAAEILRGSGAVGFPFDGNTATLSVEQAAVIKAATGRSIGELALLGIEQNAPPEKQGSQRQLIRETIDLMSAFHSSVPAAKSTDTRQPALRE